MTLTHPPRRTRLLALLAAVASVLGITLIALPATPAHAASACSSPWNSTVAYTGGQTASYNGDNWSAKWWTQGDVPGNNAQNVWVDQGACTSGGGGGGGGGSSCSYPAWVAGQYYNVGAIVTYTPNGGLYIATNANPGYDPTISTWFWSPYTCTGGGGGGGGGSNGFVVSQAQFNQIFPNRNSFYTYDGLVAAVSAFPGFATTGSTATQQQEAAAFLANVDHETGGLVYIREIDQSGNYCASEPYGCPAGSNQYYGRGPLQISWNFNYYAAGNAIGVDLLDNPDLAATDSATSWKTALWYWMTQSGPGTMTAHNAMVNGAGFGQTIWAINGSIECNGGNTAEMQDRVNDYQSITGVLGVSPGGNLTC